MSHATTSDLIPLYAIDALTESERTDVSDHLDSCATCLIALDRFQGTAALLVPDEKAPEDVWERIVEVIQSPERRDPVASIESRARRRARRWMTLTAVAAATALVLGTIAVAQRSVINGLREDSRLVTSAEELSGAPGSIVADLVDTNVVVAKVVLSTDGRGFVLPTEGLAPLDNDRTYQLWVITGDQNIISAGILGSQPAPSAFTWTGEVSGFALTREVAGGVVSSAGDVVSVVTDV